MKVVFRTDASLEIGLGHLMRCLTLADGLRELGAACLFICREHRGHRMDLVQTRGFPVRALPIQTDKPNARDEQLAGHVSWLGCDWRKDAEQTVNALGDAQPDWLIVDHYALDVDWETKLRAHVGRLMAIDDLADRRHDAHLLLDQNLGRVAADYAELVPAECKLLIGPRYALLRPEFAEVRGFSLARRCEPRLNHLIISMGGVDFNNATWQVLDALQRVNLPAGCHVTVVMGEQAPWLESVRAHATRSRWSCEVLVGMTDMAKLMADSDLAIGAAGSTSWERCCLGLPSLIAVLGDNQRESAHALVDAGCGHFLGEVADLASTIPIGIKEVTASPVLMRMSQAARTVCDGRGLERVLGHLQDWKR